MLLVEESTITYFHRLWTSQSALETYHTKDYSKDIKVPKVIYIYMPFRQQKASAV